MGGRIDVHFCQSLLTNLRKYCLNLANMVPFNQTTIESQFTNKLGYRRSQNFAPTIETACQEISKCSYQQTIQYNLPFLHTFSYFNTMATSPRNPFSLVKLDRKYLNVNKHTWSTYRYFKQISYPPPPNCSTGCLDQSLRGCYN